MNALRRTLAVLGGALLLVGTLLLALPTDRLCNRLIREAGLHDVTLCIAERTAAPLACGLQETTLLFGHSPVAKIGSISLTPWRMEAHDIRLLGMAATSLPPSIETVEYTPFDGTIRARGAFGSLRGHLDLPERRLRLELSPSSLMKKRYRALLRQFKRKNGKYLYETAF